MFVPNAQCLVTVLHRVLSHRVANGDQTTALYVQEPPYCFRTTHLRVKRELNDLLKPKRRDISTLDSGGRQLGTENVLGTIVILLLPNHCLLKVMVNFTTTDGEEVSNATLYNSLDTFELQRDKLHVSRSV